MIITCDNCRTVIIAPIIRLPLLTTFQSHKSNNNVSEIIDVQINL